MDGPFRYRKEFAGIEKELRMLARERELYRNFPYKERMHDLRERSMAAAELLLKREGIRRNTPSVPQKTDKYTERIQAMAECPEKGMIPPSSGEKKKEPARKQKGPAFRKVKPQL